MKYLVINGQYTGHILTVKQDENTESPRKWDNVGTLVTSHGTYSLGDEKAKNVDKYDSWAAWSVCL